MKFIKLIIVLLVTVHFAQAQNDHSDCTQSFNICSSNIYHFNKMGKTGDRVEYFDLSNEQKNSDINEEKETNSIWLKWVSSNEGKFAFTIKPVDDNDDIDFVLYKGASNSCSELEKLRKMTSGPNLTSFKRGLACTGVTGLAFNSEDIEEASGCNMSDDNFLKSVSSASGESYFLLINNYNANSGFDFELISDGNFSLLECNQSKDFKLEIYPNPVTEFIILKQLSLLKGSIKYMITNIEGKQIIVGKYDISGDELKVKIGNLPSSQYVVTIIDENNNTYSQKFIKA